MEVNLVAKIVLQDTLDKASRNFVGENNNGNNNKNDLIATNIVNAAVCPVVDDLLEFIAEEKLSLN